jgi:poly-gamma-glutamate synthesis protein (capsule biosynthesis protein)
MPERASIWMPPAPRASSGQANGPSPCSATVCVGPELSWAGEGKPGCAYIRILPADGGPSRPQADLVIIDPASQALMEADVAAAKGKADLVVVALHKGITHRPATLAPMSAP